MAKAYYQQNGELKELTEVRLKYPIDDTTISPDTAWSSAKIAQTVAPALTNTVSGSVIAVDDVSPLEHQVGCKVERINLAPFPESFTVTGTYYWDLDKVLTKPFEFSVKNVSGDSEHSVILFYDSGAELVQSFKLERGKPYANTVSLVSLSRPVSKIGFYSDVSYPASQGKTVTLNQVSVTETGSALPYTPYIPDLSAVTVSRAGRNICPIDINDSSRYNEESRYRLPMLDNREATVTISGTDPGVYLYVQYSTDGGITFKGIPENEGYFFVSEAGRSRALTFQTHKDVLYALFLYPLNKAREIKDIMLNFGNKKSFEPYVEPQTLTPSPDGTVTGMTSLSPNMTILTDNPGAAITAEYNADTKLYIDHKFAELQAAILSGGANI